jgi:hypothetical protein
MMDVLNREIGKGFDNGFQRFPSRIYNDDLFRKKSLSPQAF